MEIMRQKFECMGKGGLNRFSFCSQASSSEANLKHTKFLSLINKRSAIVSAVILYSFGKLGEIKTVSVFTRLLCLLNPWCRLNWLGKELEFGKRVLVEIVGIAVYKIGMPKMGDV